jgi:hypothetical protein
VHVTNGSIDSPSPILEWLEVPQGTDYDEPRPTMSRRLQTLAVLLAMAPAWVTARAGELTPYQTRYYVIHTDLGEDAVREATVRMTKMAEEYANRTKDFSGAIRSKLPFYLFGNPEDYYALGAPRESAGVFNGQALMAVAKDMDERTWHTVQHEGFHQFAAAVIGGQIPPWVNEGLAEYFGEAVFTGDGYVSGGISQWRLERIRKRFKNDEFLPLAEMMNLTMNDWNNDLSLANYDQAWSMVHFLAHGDEGRYQRAFGAFMGAVGKGKPWQAAWKSTFGDAGGFEQRWRDWWEHLPDHPTADAYVKATTATLASFLARALSQGQRFEDFAAFIRVAEAEQLKSHAEDWLPPKLLAGALAQVKKLGVAGVTFEIADRGDARMPELLCKQNGQIQFTGKFAVRGGRVQSVRVE